MLQSIRDRMSGPIVWGIVGFLVLLFAVWGIGVQSFIGGDHDPTLAKVGSVKIKQSTFQNAYNQRYGELVQMMGKQFNPDMIDQKKLRADVLQGLVENAVMNQYARRAGYRTANRQIVDYLQSIPSFQQDGHFSAQNYRRVLAMNGQTPDAFESRVREALAVQQLRNAVLQSAFVTPKQGIADWRLHSEKRSFQALLIDPKHFLDQVKVSDAQAQDYYAAHKKQFVAPERVKLAYVELRRDDLKPQQPPTTQELKSLYEKNKDSRFTQPEQRKVSHILISPGSDAAAAKKKIEMIEDKLKHGAKFSKLAEEYSDDAASAKKGGDLGWVTKGQMVPSFDKALFALAKPGDVSKPVKTRFGWHLIKLDGIRPKQVEAFDDPKVQQTLRRISQRHAAASLFEKDAHRLSDLAFEHPNSLDQVAQTLNLKVQQTGWLEKGMHPSVGDDASSAARVIGSDAVQKVAFSADLLQKGENSKPITIGDGDEVVVRKADYQPRRQQTFDEVKSQVLQVLRKQQAEKLARDKADRILAKLKAGASVQAVHDQSPNLEVQSQTDVGRDASKIDPDLLKGVFAMPRPGKTSGGSDAVVSLKDGKLAVVALTDVKESAAPPADSKDFQALMRTRKNALAAAQFEAYRKTLDQQISIDMESKPQAPSGN
jgi:Parvulin-like peptidyl-prolyl isomerase